MTSRKDLEALAALIRAEGGTVDFVYDTNGYIDGVSVTDCVDRGEFPPVVGPLAAAELMRDWLANTGRFS